MWNALRSDLQEFVSTVADDTSNVLSKLDTGLNNEVDDDNDVDDDPDAEGNSSSNNKKRAVNHAELKEIMTLLRDHPGTYTEDLADEDDKEAVKTFLDEFSIDAKTDDIAQVLETHEETVKKHFADLSPTQVSYEDFWKRYFFRCDEDRIARQLAEETERARQARAEAIQGGIDAVTNLFGGAVKAVTDTIAPEASSSGGGGTGKTADGKINFFGAGGRPPFVMNTAMDESGASDDEEDMGWDDDDSEDLEFDEGPSEADSKTEQIEFTDKVSEDLLAKLKQATEERDQIQQTVHLQSEEIKALKEKLEGGDVGADTDAITAANAKEVDDLKLKLFEKEAELAAVKSKDNDDDMDESGHDISSITKLLGELPKDQLAQLKSDVFGISDEIKQVEAEKFAALEKQIQELTQSLDSKEAALVEATTKTEDSGEKLAALEVQVQELTASLAAKDAALLDVNDKLTSTSKELEASRSQLSSDQANAANADNALENMEAALQSVQSSLDTLQLEHEGLQQSSQQAQADSASKLSALKASHAEQIASLTVQLEQANEKVQQGEDAFKEMEAELVAAKQQPVVAPIPPSTPDSMSTGVNVEAMTPAFTTPLQSDAGGGGDDDEGDDWGDDWD